MKGTKQNKSFDTLNKIKNDYFYTRLLSDQSFNSLKRNEKKLLMIDWGFPGDSIMDVTGGVRAKGSNLLSPPPNVYAKFDDSAKNLKEISSWWKLGSASQKEIIEAYSNMPFGNRMGYQHNIIAMMSEQDRIFCTKSNTDCVGDSLVREDSPLSHLAKNSDRNDRAVAGIQRTRHSSSSSSSSSSSPNSDDTREKNNGKSLRPLATTSTPLQHRRARSRIGPSPQQELQVQTTFDLSSVSNALPPSATTMVNDDEATPHSQGLFSTGTSNSDRDFGSSRRSLPKHVASSEIMKKVFAAMRSVEKFTSFTAASNEVMMNCNDLFLV